MALLAGGALALPALSGCAADDPSGRAAAQDIAPSGRDKVADGGTLRWAVDAVPTTLNTFQADADPATARVAQAVLPALFTLDGQGRPQRNPDYLESAEVVEREPKQVVLYKLDQKAVWSDGREIGAPDFAAQWRALSGRDSAFWTARNAGYDRIEEIQKGANDLEVKVTFKKPYTDWQSLFSPLYPKGVTGTPASFNDGARTTLKATAGPFRLDRLDRKAGTVTLARNPRWWGEPAKLDRLVLDAVPRDQRSAALAAGRVHIAEIDRTIAERIALSVQHRGRAVAPPPHTPDGVRIVHAAAHGPAVALTPWAALRSWAVAHGSDEEEAEAALAARARTATSIRNYTAEQGRLHGLVVRRSLEPAFTQLALNGESGPLADDRVRRALARALDRTEIAATVLRPLGLPVVAPGSHLALAGQRAYTDNSGALGEQSAQEAQALLADAGWVPGGALRKSAPAKAGSEGSGAPDDGDDDGEDGEDGEDDGEETGEDGAKNAARPAVGVNDLRTLGIGTPGIGARGIRVTGVGTSGISWVAPRRTGPGDGPSDDGLYIVGDDQRPGVGRTQVLAPAPVSFQDLALQPRAAGEDATRAGATAADRALAPRDDTKGGPAGAYAPAGTAAPVAAGGRLGKDGKPLALRFVLPDGPGAETLRAVGQRIVRMLDRIGVQTEITTVPDALYFKDHIATGRYDLALYSWPATAFPATDARPIYAKPRPADDGSLLVEQNYTRVGTDYIDQLFEQAVGELDQDEARDLVRRADARIWAAAGSIPLYQRPELVAVRPSVRNAGAFGLAAPRYQDIGFAKPKPAAGGKGQKNGTKDDTKDEKERIKDGSKDGAEGDAER
ncbi:ABC transporter family substrate-binding protein [Streptomyces sp. NPDC000594]|uniref:ABC transporter family substrate-binding protein n=1 Tax=Streptomyces sp. NPDC000594 TaxID=3154261 RepID=UPI0033244F04